MAHIQSRNVFTIDADKIRIEGRHTTDAEVDFETGGNKKLRFNQPLDIDGSKGAYIQGKKGQQLIKDEDGTAIMEVKTDGNLKLLTSVDFNGQAPINFTGGGGGGSTTTSGINSENLPGQTLEDELDAITLAGTNQGTQITANTTAIATNTADIATNTGNIASITTQQNTDGLAIASNALAITNLGTQQTTNTGAITALQTTQGTQGTDITNLQTTQAS